MQLFGRKRRQEPVRPAPTRVFPEEVFKGEAGAMLVELGITPDAKGNVLENQGPPTAHLQASRQELAAVLESVNGSVPYKVGAVLQLPEAMWNAELGWFLINQLDMRPHRPWNVLMFPLDEDGARATGLPLHATAKGLRFAPGVIHSTIDEVRRAFSGGGDAATRAATMTLDNIAGNFPAHIPADPPGRFDEPTALARRRIRALAFGALADPITKEVVMRCHDTILAEPAIQLTA